MKYFNVTIEEKVFFNAFVEVPDDATAADVRVKAIEAHQNNETTEFDSTGPVATEIQQYDA